MFEGEEGTSVGLQLGDKGDVIAGVRRQVTGSISLSGARLCSNGCSSDADANPREIACFASTKLFKKI